MQTATSLTTEDFLNDKQVFIYPNPTNDFFTLDFSNFDIYVEKKISILNYLGQEVFEIFTRENSINIDQIKTSGIYFIKIYDLENNLITTKRVVKK